ncbi:MAG TPA: maltose alpha-D-glucosyltransferase [Polyangiaceae bacterium]|jgi:maltose alpha-D-glucosyltransferase/alpha-amylase
MNGPTNAVRRSHRGGGDGPTWFKDAIIYEVRTRSFYDSNDDGVGDLKGLTSKLDYLQDLGITALWLLPLYPSPGRDDGYDISDYTDVHPDVGTLADFEEFVAAAHKRGLKVITELVLNHTSDQHPWFQRARRAPRGSKERDFYVWGDSPDQYHGARIIFKDFEVSNWSWDREANAYYWHRFYAHQPDLNFENPAVGEALLGVVDFWLAKGVDGLRLDAVPYLFEEEGTNCENLPRTHAFLKRLRAHMDSKFPNRMLLAEANQWPEDAAAYFGNGDECHMNFHFPLMPRMFMSIHQEDRFPIIDIFAQTPEIPATCQWALFLRNHDELTLEMVTDEERDYMYRAYADQAAMRINLGIRRRLAPLVGNARRKMELLNGLLFSLPGTPVLYYGDEIGMGDNVYLGDRNGVRTPMQWSMDRNAGFSRANPQRLVLPVVIDPEYHFGSLNVENQQQNPTSLLWWTKRLIALRKRFAAFGRGTTEFLHPTNSRVLAFVRQYEGESVLVVANLSRFMQYAELDLSKYRGATPIELFGATRFPTVGEGAYAITLGPHDFSWFSLEAPSMEEQRRSLPPAAPPLEGTSVEALLLGDERATLADALPAYLESRSWYAGRGRALRSMQLAGVVPIEANGSRVYVAFVRAEYADGSPETYALPLAWVAGEPRAGASVLATVRGPDGSRGALVDALEEPKGAMALLEVAVRPRRLPGDVLDLVSVAPPEAGAVFAELDAATEARKVGRERRHTRLRYGDRLVLKLARRIEEGSSPELEIERALAARGSELVPALRGSLEVRRRSGELSTLALVHAAVPHAETVREVTSKELKLYFERVLARDPSEAAPEPTTGSLLSLATRVPPPAIGEKIGVYRETAARLGARVAELHLALSQVDDPSFKPEPYSTFDVRSKYQSLRNLSGRVLRAVRWRLGSLPPRAREEASRLLAREAELLRTLDPLLRVGLASIRIRTHGNLHLGHVLFTGKGFVFTDLNDFGFIPLNERRRKRSPLRDLAWMVGSFELAALSVLFDPAAVREADVEKAHPWAVEWTSWTAAAFLGAYWGGVAGSSLVPASREEATTLLEAFLLERALYQLQAALDENPAGVTIPLSQIGRLISQPG